MLDSFFCWKDILLYGDTYHLISRIGIESEKVDGGNSRVHLPAGNPAGKFWHPVAGLKYQATTQHHDTFDPRPSTLSSSISVSIHRGGGLEGEHFFYIMFYKETSHGCVANSMILQGITTANLPYVPRASRAFPSPVPSLGPRNEVGTRSEH